MLPSFLWLAVRLLITGALHEDGFADFCDGFGGGTSRERTLTIMKDSHIGTYGVLGLVLYALVAWNVIAVLLDYGMSPLVLLAVDTLAKGLSSTIIYFLPYARSEGEAKNGLVYVSTPLAEKVLTALLALMPAALCLVAVPEGSPTLLEWGLMLLLPVMGCGILFAWMRRRLGGYTGDCCGATFIITETLMLFSLCLLLC